MLTEKEVMELTERAMGHIAMLEKYQMYAQQCNDQQVVNLLQRHYQKIQQHYQTITNVLQNPQSIQGMAGTQRMGTTPAQTQQNYSQNYTYQQ